MTAWRVLAGLALAALLGCGSPPPTTGYITAKHHRAAYVESITYSVCVAYDKNGSCAVSVPIPDTIDHPERWLITLEEGDAAGELEVSERIWRQYDVGNHYPDPR